MSTPKADDVVAAFLTEFPEHSAEFGYHRDYGPVMSAEGSRLFIEWAVRTGRIKAENRSKAAGLIDAINQHRVNICPHDRLTEAGQCRSCGADCRGTTDA